MTIFDSIKANPVFVDFSAEYIQSVLSGRSIDGTATYSADSLKEVELASADLYMEKALLPEFKEGQLSVKYNATLLKQRAKAIYQKYNDAKLEDFNPKKIDVGMKFS